MTQSGHLSRYQGIQLVPDVLGVAVGQLAGVLLGGGLAGDAAGPPDPRPLEHGLDLDGGEDGVGDAPLEGAVLGDFVEVVDAVCEGGVVTVRGALRPAELPEVVGNIL